MVIKYNPYGWEIRPHKTETQKTIEKQREIARLEQQIAFLMNEANSRINQFISHNHDPVTLLLELDKIFPEVTKIIQETAKLNFELYGFSAYPKIP